MDGLLVIDKPAGPTSHDVVARVRRLLDERRVGHTGTLDPFATGVLPLVLGRATRLARFLSASDKCYDAEVRLGVATDTYDATGEQVGVAYDGSWPSADAVDRALEEFRGQFLQQPPAFSAKKIAGRRSYRLARAAASPHPSPARVTAHAIEVAAVDGNRVSLRIRCSAGFYVRSLAHDLGQRLRTGAHLAALRRTRSGDLDVGQALPLDRAERDSDAARAAVIPLDRMLPGLVAVILNEEGARHARHGRDLRAADIVEGAAAVDGSVRLLDRSGQLLGVAEPGRPPGVLHPSIVLV
jgi:tRNA pseudouridine55 synthase